MRLPICLYGNYLTFMNPNWVPPGGNTDVGQLATAVSNDIRAMYDEIRKLTEAKIDGYNIDPTFIGTGLTLGTNSPTNPGVLINGLSPSGGGPGITLKPDGRNINRGVELAVDTVSGGIYGRVCIKDQTDYALNGKNASQLISLIPDNYTNASPGGTISTPKGAMTLTAKSGSVININNQLAIGSGLGAITHLLGPSDQTLTIISGSGHDISLQAPTTHVIKINNGGLDVVAISSPDSGTTGQITIADATTIAVGSINGLKIGGATTQKLGLWNHAPNVQPGPYSATNTKGALRTFDVASVVLVDLARVVATLIQDMQTVGFVG